MKRTSGSKRQAARAWIGRRDAWRAWLRRLSPIVALLLVALSVHAQEADPKGTGKGRSERVPAEGNVVIKDGDTMWDLSGRYLGSSYEWPRLWSYNPEVTNPHWIYPGHTMRLREGAEGGTNAEGIAEGGDGRGSAPGIMAKSGQFGQGFGTRNLRRRDGSIVIGEVVYLDKKALQHSGRIVGSSEDHMMLSPTDEVYVKFGDGVSPVEGKEMTIYRHSIKKENSPKAGEVYVVREGDDREGEIVTVLGALRVQSYDEEKRIARAVITEALDPIERGFEVTDVPRTLAEVPPRTNNRKVESKILAATRPLGTLGHNQLVFIGAGEKDGVQAGNRFLVVRQGDTWRKTLTLNEINTGAERPAKRKPKDDQYPWEPVAEIRVLYVRPDTCTGIITSSREEVGLGDRVEMREGF
jgi:hypothetical protein